MPFTIDPALVLDAAALDRLEELGGNQLVREMIALFVIHGPRQLDAACAAWDVRNLEVLRRSVHSLKSSAANLGARGLSDLAAGAELALVDQELPPDIPQRLAAMHAELERVADALRQQHEQLS